MATLLPKRNAASPQETPALRLSVQFGKGGQPARWPLSMPRMRRMALAALTSRATSAEISLVIVGQAEGQQLNRQYRHKDYATNILTFDYAPPPNVVADLVICQPVIAAEARRQGKTLDHHAAHLLIHGVLHACGFDHLQESQAHEMESLEVAILRRFRIPDPYST